MIQPLQRNNPFRMAYDLPELLGIQRASFYKFLKEGISEEFSKIASLRLRGNAASVELIINGKDFRLIAPEDTPRDCVLKVKTYSCKLYVQAQMVWRDGAGKCLHKTSLEWVLLGHLPLMTKRGHFIVNGSPRIVVHQVVRSPGIYFQEVLERDSTKRNRFYGDIIPRRGLWVRLQTTQKGRIEARLKRGKRVSADMLQRCLQVIEKPEYDQSQLGPLDNSQSLAPSLPDTKSALWFQAWARMHTQDSLPQRDRSCKLSTCDGSLQVQAASPHPPRRGGEMLWRGSLADNEPLSKRSSWRGMRSHPSSPQHKHTTARPFSIPKDKLPLALDNWKPRCHPMDDILSSRLAGLSQKLGQSARLIKLPPQPSHITNFATICFLSAFYKPYDLGRALTRTSACSRLGWQVQRMEAELMAEDEAFAHTYDKLYRPVEDKEREELANKRQVGPSRRGARGASPPHARGWKWAKKRLPDKGFKRERCSKNLWEAFKVASRYDLSALGRERINKKLDISILDRQLTSVDIKAASHWLSRLTRGERSVDDIDHSQNRRVRTSGELLQAQFENAIDRLRRLAWNKLKEVANLYVASCHPVRGSGFDSLRGGRGEHENGSLMQSKPTSTRPHSQRGVMRPSSQEGKALLKEILSTKPINGALRELFGGNALSQYMDQTNPLAEITHKRRISSLGSGGVSRESAGMAIRGIHPTHYGRICPIETPEGKNAGLVNSLASYARIDNRGFLETPCYKVIKGQIQPELGFSFFSAKRESQEGLHIAPSDLRSSWNNVLAATKVPVRVADNLLDLFTRASAYRVDCIGISPIQMISVATSLIPFLEHNDANRALMGSNMQRQAVPLMIPERPIVGTGLEALVVAESGHLLESQLAGFVSYVSADRIVVESLQRNRGACLQACSPSLSRGASWCRQLGDAAHRQQSHGFKLSVQLVQLLRGYQHCWLADIGDMRSYCTHSHNRIVTHVDPNVCSEGAPLAHALQATRRERCPSLQERIVKHHSRARGEHPVSWQGGISLVQSTSQHNTEQRFMMTQAQPTRGKQESNRFATTHRTCLSQLGFARAWQGHLLLRVRPRGMPDQSARGGATILLAQIGSAPVLQREHCVGPYRMGAPRRRGSYSSKDAYDKGTAISTHAMVASQPQQRWHLTLSDHKGVSRSSQAAKGAKGLVCVPKGGRPQARWDQRSHSSLPILNDYQMIACTHLLNAFDRSNQDTCLTQRALINEGEWVQRGDALTDCSASQKGELAVGRNALIAYLPWEGFNFEDAIVVSERLVKEHVYTSLHVERYDMSAQESKEGSEWFTNDLPGITTKSVAHLDDSGLPKVGSLLKEGNVLVGRVRYSNKRPRTPYERLLGDILGEKNLSVRDASLYVPRGVCARVIARNVIETGRRSNALHPFSPKEEHLLPRQLNPLHPTAPRKGMRSNQDAYGTRERHLQEHHLQRLRNDERTRSPLGASTFYKAQEESVTLDQGVMPSNQSHRSTTTRAMLYTHDLPLHREGALRAGLLTSKTHKTGIISYQPRHEPHKQVTRMARYDDNLPDSRIPKVVHVFLAERRALQIGDKMSGRHGNKGVVSTILPTQDMPYLGDGTPVDILLNPLGVPSRMNVGQVYECLLGLAATYLNQHLKLAAFDELHGPEASQSLVYLKLYQARLQSGQNWLFQIDHPGKTRLMDGRSGECFEQWVTVGRAYMLKLIHMVNEKIHARATGPYALITQQPLRGRSKRGGQRLGEMEVWALEGFGAAYTLQELLTKKSDDVVGRKEIATAILPRPHTVSDVSDARESPNKLENRRSVLGHPEIFKVLVCELKALCLDVGVYSLTNTSFQRHFVSEVG